MPVTTLPTPQALYVPGSGSPVTVLPRPQALHVPGFWSPVDVLRRPHALHVPGTGSPLKLCPGSGVICPRLWVASDNFAAAPRVTCPGPTRYALRPDSGSPVTALFKPQTLHVPGIGLPFIALPRPQALHAPGSSVFFENALRTRARGSRMWFLFSGVRIVLGFVFAAAATVTFDEPPKGAERIFQKHVPHRRVGRHNVVSVAVA